MLELLAGVFIALAALALVLEPLVRPVRAYAVGRGSPADEIDFSDPQESESPKVRALLALKEIEFDRATGKLSDEDYAGLKAKYSATALEAIRAEEEMDQEAATDPAEAAIRRARGRAGLICPTCGPRPETNAKFCSNCGRPLTVAGAGPRCSGCGSELPPSAKFCGECGAKGR